MLTKIQLVLNEQDALALSILARLECVTATVTFCIGGMSEKKLPNYKWIKFHINTMKDRDFITLDNEAADFYLKLSLLAVKNDYAGLLCNSRKSSRFLPVLLPFLCIHKRYVIISIVQNNLSNNYR
jgi:hypothetical protein